MDVYYWIFPQRHLADSDAGNGGPREDGGRGEEEEEDGEDAVAEAKVQQKQAAWFPSLVIEYADR